MCSRPVPGTGQMMVRRLISREKVQPRKETGGTKTEAGPGNSMFACGEESTAGPTARTW